MSLKLKNIYIQPFLVTSVLARLATYKSTSPASHKFFKVLRSMRSRSLRSKRFQSSYWAKVRAEAKKRLKPSFMVFLLLSQLSRRTLRGNACHAG